MSLKAFKWSLFFSLFFVHLNTFGQEVGFSCISSDFAHPEIAEETVSVLLIAPYFMDSHSENCGVILSTFEHIDVVTLSREETRTENFKSSDFSSLSELIEELQGRSQEPSHLRMLFFPSIENSVMENLQASSQWTVLLFSHNDIAELPQELQTEHSLLKGALQLERIILDNNKTNPAWKIIEYFKKLYRSFE